MKKTIKVVYKSLWDTATPEEKIQYKKKLDSVYDLIFDKIETKLREEQSKDARVGKRKRTLPTD